MIERRVQLSLPHRVFFTSGVFENRDPALRAALAGETRDRQVKVQVVVEQAVASAHPGLLPSIGAWISAEAPGIVSAGPPVVIPGGEACKNDWALVAELWKSIHDAGLDRHSCVLAIGGGALLDLAGFAAATAHRGIRLVRMPTTTLSQADGGVGVKNGINHFGKKNWVGTFAVPAAVINDFAFLRTLPRGTRREGIIEAIKVALIRDRKFFEEIEDHAAELSRLDEGILQRVIRRSAELHVDHICTGGDPFESGSARPLDFGHWAAHKLEQLSGFRISHGRAVAIGMALDLTYAELLGLLPSSECARILGLIRTIGFRTWDDELLKAGPDGSPAVLQGLEEFREHLGGDLCITLVTRPGSMIEVHEMDVSLLRQALGRLEESARTPALLCATGPVAAV